MSKLLAFLKDETGASAGEYALILAVVGIGIVGAAGALKDAIAGAMNDAATVIKTGKAGGGEE
ncbi:MAG: Flp family type IVb pilin [Phenylobacterium sp.]|uniref:Flp family type IVb pilin n=1 Tax=Phenylobacterium sp. TaxID=1871053 RepID=UPI0039190F9D